jgi:predicted permease
MMYAFLLGLILNAVHIPLPQVALDMALNFRGAYTVLGMMIIGLGLSGLKNLSLDGPFLLMAFIAKFVLWPGIMLAVIAVDRAYFGLFSPDMHNIMVVLSIVPMAANTVLYATEMRVHPEKAATAVALTTLFTIVYIPVMVTMFVR